MSAGLNLFVIQGGSATGKSTLARKLAKDLDVYLLSKDYFKELMYDKLGAPDAREESELYGLSATKALYAAAEVFLDRDKSLILESVFTKGLAEQDMWQLIDNKPVKLVQVYVTASMKVRQQREQDRIESGERHEAHPVIDFSIDESKFGKLDFENTIEVNTDSFDDNDYKKLLASVKMMIGDYIK